MYLHLHSCCLGMWVLNHGLKTVQLEVSELIQILPLCFLMSPRSRTKICPREIFIIENVPLGCLVSPRSWDKNCPSHRRDAVCFSDQCWLWMALNTSLLISRALFRFSDRGILSLVLVPKIQVIDIIILEIRKKKLNSKIIEIIHFIKTTSLLQ